MKHDIYFPFAQYEREIHSGESCYLQWQAEYAVYDNSGKACAVPYETAAPFLKSSIDWMWYLLDAPAEYTHCDFSKFSSLELYFLLRERPELSFVVPWQKMVQEYKNLLYAYHPELAQDLTLLKTLSGDHWQKILQVKPEYGIYCPWQKLSGDNWQIILEEHPEFVPQCDRGKLSAANWLALLKKQIGLLLFCPPEIKSAFSPDEKEELFILYPGVRNIWNN